MVVEEENKQEIFKSYFEEKEKEINPLLNNVLHEIIKKNLLGTSGVFSELNKTICTFLNSIPNDLYQELKDCEKLSYIISNDELFINEINNIKIKIKDSTNAIFLHQTNEIIHARIAGMIDVYTEDAIKDWNDKAQKEYKMFNFNQKLFEANLHNQQLISKTNNKGINLTMIGTIAGVIVAIGTILGVFLTAIIYWDKIEQNLKKYFFNKQYTKIVINKKIH